MPLKPKLIITNIVAPALNVPINTANVTGKGMLRLLGLYQNTQGANVDSIVTIEIDGEVYANAFYSAFVGNYYGGMGIGIAAPGPSGGSTPSSVSPYNRMFNIPFERSLRVIITPKYTQESFQIYNTVDYILET